MSDIDKKNNEEIIQRFYGSYYYKIERFLDEYGRVKESRFRDFCYELGENYEAIFRAFRMNRIEENGIIFLQPSALEGIGPEPIPELTTDDLEFLDRVAERTMTEYFSTHPNGFKDSLLIARLSYTQALAMLEIKNNGLQELINKNGLNYRV